MALVVLLRGANVGGHRRLRPTALARELKEFDVTNIGAAGTFVVRRPVPVERLRAEVARRLPFDAEIVILRGRQVVDAVSRDPFLDQPEGDDVVRFVSVLAKRPRSRPPLPMDLPSTGEWLLRIVASEGLFVFGLYRRHMRVIGYLGMLDRLFGAPATTRNWKTVTAIVRALGEGAGASGRDSSRRRGGPR